MKHSDMDPISPPSSRQDAPVGLRDNMHRNLVTSFCAGLFIVVTVIVTFFFLSEPPRNSPEIVETALYQPYSYGNLSAKMESTDVFPAENENYVDPPRNLPASNTTDSEGNPNTVDSKEAPQPYFPPEELGIAGPPGDKNQPKNQSLKKPANTTATGFSDLKDIIDPEILRPTYSKPGQYFFYGDAYLQKGPVPLNLKAVSQQIGFPDIKAQSFKGGKVWAWMWVDEKGNVENWALKSVDHPDLKNAKWANLKNLQFEPGINGNQPVKVKILMPFYFGSL